MRSWLVVWLLVTLVTLVAVVVVVVALVRSVILLGRATARYRDEVAPLTAEMAAASARAAEKAASLSTRPRRDRLDRGSAERR